SSGALLVEADYVSCWVAKSRSYLGRVRADRLHDLVPIGDDRLKACSHAVELDVNKKAGLRGGWAPEYSGAAHLAGRVVKGGVTITAMPRANRTPVCRSQPTAQCRWKESRCNRSFRSRGWGASVFLQGLAV